MIQKYPDYYHALLGNISVGTFLAYLTFSIVAAVASILWELSQRDVESPNTPQKLSAKFWFAHNLFRFTSNVLCIPLAIRILLEWQSANPLLLLVLSIAVGAAIDRLAMLLRKWGVLSSDKLAQKIKEKVDQN